MSDSLDFTSGSAIITKLSLAIEVNNDTAMTTNEAIGLATYSNSESTVLTYLSKFETLWAKAEVKPSITG